MKLGCHGRGEPLPYYKSFGLLPLGHNSFADQKIKPSHAGSSCLDRIGRRLRGRLLHRHVSQECGAVGLTIKRDFTTSRAYSPNWRVG